MSFFSFKKIDFLPKTKIEIVVSEGIADSVIETIEKTAKTGKTSFKRFTERSVTKIVNKIILRSLDPSKMANFGILCSTDGFWDP